MEWIWLHQDSDNGHRNGLLSKGEDFPLLKYAPHYGAVWSSGDIDQGAGHMCKNC